MTFQPKFDHKKYSAPAGALRARVHHTSQEGKGLATYVHYCLFQDLGIEKVKFGFKGHTSSIPVSEYKPVLPVMVHFFMLAGHKTVSLCLLQSRQVSLGCFVIIIGQLL